MARIDVKGPPQLLYKNRRSKASKMSSVLKLFLPFEYAYTPWCPMIETASNEMYLISESALQCTGWISSVFDDHSQYLMKCVYQEAV